MGAMKLVIYQMAHSPFCIPITRALESLRQPFETVEVPNWDRSEVLRKTDGKSYEVPILEHGSQVVFETASDSQNIARYVDEHFAQGRLFPRSLDGINDLVIHHLENEVEGVTFKLTDPYHVDSIPDVAARGMVIRHKERKFGRGCVEAWRSQREELKRAAEAVLRPFEKMLGQNPFLLDEAPVYADFLLFGILGNLTYNNWNQIPESLTHLQKWHATMADWTY
jgi:glutathione S-transferase